MTSTETTFRILSCDYLVMKDEYQKTASDFLELASEQRLAILLRLYKQRSKVSILAKELGATVPEVYRNFERLVKADLIAKEPDGDYTITTFGKIMCSQIPSIRFLSNNKKYFKEHNFGDDVPTKYLQRIGSLEGCTHIKGFVKVLERWKEIIDNANEYIYNVLFEIPYTSDLIEPIAKKVSGGVKLRSVLYEYAVIAKERKQIFDKLGFKKLVEEGKIERRMKENVKTVVILNEKQGLVMFPTVSGKADMSEGFFGEDESFHEWCFDYFNYCWEKSGPFREAKLGQE
jgi:predicted transcriptional regulator